MTIKVDKIRSFVYSVFKELGLSNDYAKKSMEVILQAELTGVLTHGLAKLPFYVMRYRNNGENINPDYKIINNHKSNILLDADNGSGLIIGPIALEMCIDRTKKNGISTIVIKNSGHFGCGNYYSWKFAEENLIGIVMTNTSPLMAPYGGKKREIGTNPITISIPAKNHDPIILDMATSIAAYGKIQVAATEKKNIPFGWAKDREGLPTDDPFKALEGTIEPLGSYKGYGLAVIVDALTSLLANSEFGDKITSIDGLNTESRECVSHFMLGIDPSTFYNINEFLDYVDFYIEYMKNSPKAKGVEEIFLPGEIEFRKFRANNINGLSINKDQSDKLMRMIDELDLNPNGYSNFEEFINNSY